MRRATGFYFHHRCPQEFQILGDWFAPFLGLTLRPTLAIVFMILTFGPKDPLVFAAWAVSGFACGAAARGGIKRALTVPLGAFRTLFTVLGASFCPMIKMFGSVGLQSLPQPPIEKERIHWRLSISDMRKERELRKSMRNLRRLWKSPRRPDRNHLDLF